MSTNSTYQPYIQLSFKILECINDFKVIQSEKEKTLQDLNVYNSLLHQHENILNHFPQVKKDAYSQLVYLNIDANSQAELIDNCRVLEVILNNINNCKELITYLEINCKQDQLSRISNAERVISSTLLQLQLTHTKEGLNDINYQVGILTNVIKEYKSKQERIRLDKELEDKRLKDEAERIRLQKIDNERIAKENEERIRIENEERERKRRELEEKARLEEERRKEAQMKLWLNIGKWVGIIAVAVLLIIYVIIPVVTWIIANIIWILIGIAILVFIIIKANK
jgi:hypothetical protein